MDDFELETKGGKVVFEIEIEQQDDQEVEVKIDAFTGEILSVKWDD
ncbi:PepSY domain-containing protein [Halalkalibacter akibai]